MRQSHPSEIDKWTPDENSIPTMPAAVGTDSTKRGPAENVDADIAPKRGRSREPSTRRVRKSRWDKSEEKPAKRSARTQTNFSKELTADEILAYKTAQNEIGKASRARKSVRTQNKFSR